MEHIIHPVYYQDFFLAGRCEFMVRSIRTGNEEIFVVNKSKHEDFYWVNNRLREPLGKLTPVPGTAEVMYDFEPKNSFTTKFQQDQINIFSWLWRNVLKGTAHKQAVVVNYQQRCAHCHRPLDNPDSIIIGIGPDCFKKLNLTHKHTKTEV